MKIDKKKGLEMIENICVETAYCKDVRAQMDDIYQIVHVINDTCENKHRDWVIKHGLEKHTNETIRNI